MKVKNVIFKFGFLEFDLKDFVFTDPFGIKHTTGGIHIQIDKTGIRGGRLDNLWPAKCLFSHPHIETTGHMWIHGEELLALFEHPKNIIKQYKKKKLV